MDNTGPRLFLQRLHRSASFPPDVRFCNPNLQDVAAAKANTSDTLIARLDGASYYRMTPRNLAGLLRQRRPALAKLIAPLRDSRMDIPLLTRTVNRYLDRCAIWLLGHADGIVFQSQLSRQMHLQFLGFEPGRVPETVIPNGVSLQEFSPGVATKLPGAPAILISASIYRLHKRLHDAIRLVNRLAAEFPDVRLHVLGNFDALVQRSIAAEDTSRCTFHGRVAPERLPEFYGGSDMQLSLCIYDVCPNVVCEGLASGLPVLTPQQSGAAELIGTDEPLWLVDEGLTLEYRELHVPEAIPAIPIDEYAARVRAVYQDLARQKERARHRAESCLDIRSIAKRYADFARVVMVQSSGQHNGRRNG